jgi:hypothetical protein
MGSIFANYLFTTENQTTDDRQHSAESRAHGVEDRRQITDDPSGIGFCIPRGKQTTGWHSAESRAHGVEDSGQLSDDPSGTCLAFRRTTILRKKQGTEVSNQRSDVKSKAFLPIKTIQHSSAPILHYPRPYTHNR